MAYSGTADTLALAFESAEAGIILIGLKILFTYTLSLQYMFHTTLLDPASWLLIQALTMFKFFAVEAEKWLLLRPGIHRM